MVDYGRHSETELVLVSNEGLSILNLLKIQSTPFGNTGDSSGDEMNLHMPQDEESEAELKNLAAVPFQIISPANNQSIDSEVERVRERLKAHIQKYHQLESTAPPR